MFDCSAACTRQAGQERCKLAAALLRLRCTCDSATSSRSVGRSVVGAKENFLQVSTHCPPIIHISSRPAHQIPHYTLTSISFRRLPTVGPSLCSLSLICSAARLSISPSWPTSRNHPAVLVSTYGRKSAVLGWKDFLWRSPQYKLMHPLNAHANLAISTSILLITTHPSFHHDKWTTSEQLDVAHCFLQLFNSPRVSLTSHSARQVDFTCAHAPNQHGHSKPP